MVLYRFNLILLIVTSLVLRIACDLMEPKSSLAFVIDKTKSMEPVIEKVRSNVRKIFDKVTSSAESPIENFVLVFFGDPNVSEALITKDRELFENTLQSVEPEDGGSCPEMALTGIQKAINASLPGSYVYVFTDASAEDYVIYDEVRLSAQEKQCQVVFILNGMCSHRTELSDDYIVYPKLAEATSGQVFHVKNEDDIDMILEYVEKSIDSRRINLLSKRLGASDNKTFEVEIDSTMDQLTVSITITDFGSNSSELDAIILTPESFTVDEPPLVKLGDILVKRDEFSLKGLTGKYTIQCYSNASTYVLVTARSNVSFRHGFSTKLVPSLDNTVTGPIRGTANYLFIQLFGNDVSLTSVDLLEPNYRSILKLDLRLHNEKKQLYVTELFKPPLAKFRISVIGIDDHGKHIRRYGNLVLETEAPRPPNITITGNTSVEYGGYLQLNCSVDAFPKPKIAWKRLYDGSIMSSKVGPRNNIVLELKNLNKNVSFECNAENEVGNARETVQVKVEPKLFFDIQTPKVVQPQLEESRDPCVPSPCGPFSNCRNIGNQPSCSCSLGYIGSPPNCHPECVSNQDCISSLACINEKCKDPCPGSCGQNAKCSVINHISICTCHEGYKGDPFTACALEPIQDLPIDLCNPSPCGSNTECNDGECTCLPEYHGDPYVGCRPECTVSTDCEKHQICVNKKCTNPCPDTCGHNAICEVVNHIPMCTCPAGYTGNSFVSCNVLQAPLPTNPCNPSPCGPNSQCRQMNNVAVCSCIPGYSGNPPTCRAECTTSSECPLNKACNNYKCIDPCKGACGIRALCEVVNHNPICSCPQDYTGDPFSRCILKPLEVPPQVNPCIPSPCGPNSLCQAINESPSCSCMPQFIGSPPNCRPECSSNSECANHMACINNKS